jgi:hypothetical protein
MPATPAEPDRTHGGGFLPRAAGAHERVRGELRSAFALGAASRRTHLRDSREIQSRRASITDRLDAMRAPYIAPAIETAAVTARAPR